MRAASPKRSTPRASSPKRATPTKLPKPPLSRRSTKLDPSPRGPSADGERVRVVVRLRPAMSEVETATSFSHDERQVAAPAIQPLADSAAFRWVNQHPTQLSSRTRGRCGSTTTHARPGWWLTRCAGRSARRRASSRTCAAPSARRCAARAAPSCAAARQERARATRCSTRTSASGAPGRRSRPCHEEAGQTTRVPLRAVWDSGRRGVPRVVASELAPYGTSSRLAHSSLLRHAGGASCRAR